MAHTSGQKEKSKIKQSSNDLKCSHANRTKLARLGMIEVMDRGHSPNGEEVVMDTSKVVVGTSQKSRAALGCQPIRGCEEEKKEG